MEQQIDVSLTPINKKQKKKILKKPRVLQVLLWAILAVLKAKNQS